MVSPEWVRQNLTRLGEARQFLILSGNGEKQVFRYPCVSYVSIVALMPGFWVEDNRGISHVLLLIVPFLQNFEDFFFQLPRKDWLGHVFRNFVNYGHFFGVACTADNYRNHPARKSLMD